MEAQNVPLHTLQKKGGNDAYQLNEIHECNPIIEIDHIASFICVLM